MESHGKVDLDMIIREIASKTILSKSKVFDYTINPYIGCEHACTYCYARFMKRYTGHKEKWGEFVDIKTNAPLLLKSELAKKRIGRIWISGTCDPYQPLEKEYEITGKCLQTLSGHGWPVSVQTKSSLVLRDIELLKRIRGAEVGFSIATADDNIRRIFEPNAPSIGERIAAVEKLHSQGIRTFAMIAPLLPNVDDLPEQLIGKVDYVLVDKMNYHNADWVYRKHGLEHARTDRFMSQMKMEIAAAFDEASIPCQLLF